MSTIKDWKNCVILSIEYQMMQCDFKLKLNKLNVTYS